MIDSGNREDLHARYRAERDKRLRSEGNDQYLEPVGAFSYLLDDPYSTPFDREAVRSEVEVVVVGGGFGGLAAGARLKEAGIEDVVIIEGGGDFGGAWYWNRYPGAMCDTAAMVYLPFLEETGHRPSKKYVEAPEIFEHARRIGRTFGLYERALFSTHIKELRWDEAESRWIVRTDRGDEIHARYVASSTGPLHRPKLPGIKGIETFGGHSFHTSRWDWTYTGGSPQDPSMANLADKRVAIIGTGATAVQCISHLGRWAQYLTVFQRTPSAIDERNNHEIDPVWFDQLRPGWQSEWLRNFAILQTGGFTEEDLVKDGWTDIAKRIRDRVVAEVEAGGEFTDELVSKAFFDSDDEKMDEIRARVDRLVEDPATAEVLKPWYRQLCKRPCFHDEYLQTYNLPNVRLFDTGGMGVTEIDETGVWVGDEHVEVDCLIYASGFEVGTGLARRSGFETYGRDGISLSSAWADGMRTLHGVHVHGFPNFFLIGFAQAASLVSNVTHNLVDGATTIASVIARGLGGATQAVEATAEAEQAWMDLLGSKGRPQFLADCTPGYYNNEGKLEEQSASFLDGYPGGAVAFFDFIEAWRNTCLFEGLEFTSPSSPGSTQGQGQALLES